jgi:hypothetical protein
MVADTGFVSLSEHHQENPSFSAIPFLSISKSSADGLSGARLSKFRLVSRDDLQAVGEVLEMSARTTAFCSQRWS